VILNDLAQNFMVQFERAQGVVLEIAFLQINHGLLGLAEKTEDEREQKPVEEDPDQNVAEQVLVKDVAGHVLEVMLDPDQAVGSFFALLEKGQVDGHGIIVFLDAVDLRVVKSVLEVRVLRTVDVIFQDHGEFAEIGLTVRADVFCPQRVLENGGRTGIAQVVKLAAIRLRVGMRGVRVKKRDHIGARDQLGPLLVLLELEQAKKTEQQNKLSANY